MAGRNGGNNPLSAALAISVPYKLADCAERLNHGFSLIYQKALLAIMLRATRKKYAGCDDFDLCITQRLRTIRDFDNRITALMHGFRDVKHYYGDASSYLYLQHIRIPTLLLHARNDTFMWPSYPARRKRPVRSGNTGVKP